MKGLVLLFIVFSQSQLFAEVDIECVQNTLKNKIQEEFTNLSSPDSYGQNANVVHDKPSLKEQIISFFSDGKEDPQMLKGLFTIFLKYSSQEGSKESSANQLCRFSQYVDKSGDTYLALDQCHYKVNLSGKSRNITSFDTTKGIAFGNVIGKVNISACFNIDTKEEINVYNTDRNFPKEQNNTNTTPIKSNKSSTVNSI